MKKQSTITMYEDSFNKIIEILEKYTESLDNYYDIEECVNLIHFIQKELYSEKKQKEIDRLFVFAEWVFNFYQNETNNLSNSSELLSKFYQEQRERNND